MKRNKMALLLAALTVLLCGCSLAREEVVHEEDCFVGAVVVLEGAGERTPYEESSYELTDEEKCLVLTEETVGEGDTSIGFSCGDWFSERCMSVHDSDSTQTEGRRVQQKRTQRISMEATIFVQMDDPQATSYTWRLDAVYRRADGSLYARPTSNAVGGCIDGSTLRQAATYTVLDAQGKSVERTLEVGVTLNVSEQTQHALICGMSAENEVLARYELDFDALAQQNWTLQAARQAEWLLLEVEEDGDLKRSVIDFNDDQAACSVLLKNEDIELCAGCTALTMRTLTIQRG